MGKLHDVLELLREIEEPKEGARNPAEIQRQINTLISQVLSEANSPLITRESLMQAVQFKYKQHIKEIEKKEDKIRRGNIR